MSEKLITLEQFIESETDNLLNSYSKVDVYSITSVLLNTNSVSESFISKDVNLNDHGKQVQLSELHTVLSLPFKENGYSIKFGVVPKGKRKSITINRYFLVDEVK